VEQEEEPKEVNCCYLNKNIIVVFAVIHLKELKNLVYYFFVVSVVFIVDSKTYPQEIVVLLLCYHNGAVQK